VLLGITGFIFLAFLIQSFWWPAGSVLLPRVAVIAGLPFLVVRAVSVIRHRSDPVGQIMDLGFTVGKDPAAERRRFGLLMGAVVGLLVSIWLVGFHFAIPLWVLGYLRLGNIRWVWALFWAVAFESFIYGVFDMVIITPWPQPVLFSLLGVDYFFGY